MSGDGAGAGTGTEAGAVAATGSVAGGAAGATGLEHVIAEEYAIWKKNSPYLYDTVLTHALEWPSLTAQWLPDYNVVGKDATCPTSQSEEKLLLGTHTSDGAPNYILIVTVRLPVVGDDEAEVDAGNGVAGALVGHGAEKAASDAAAGMGGKVEVSVRIPHDQEVNRARYQPQNQFLIATKSPCADVLLFDYSKHSSNVDAATDVKDDKCRPELRLKGHTEEGYGLAWSHIQSGYLLSGADDKKAVLWDVAAKPVTGDAGPELQPLRTFEGHTAVVEDVAWHRHDANVFASVGDDKRLLIWDAREAVPKGDYVAHTAEINCVAFNPLQEYLLATGSADQTVALWDMRNMSKRMHALEGHTDEVFQLQWAPFSKSVLASSSSDRRINVWDVDRIGQEQSAEDAEDGPPELLFVHGGHTSKVSDFAWDDNDEWMIASVAEDNFLQIWQMAENIYAGDGDETNPAVVDDGDLE